MVNYPVPINTSYTKIIYTNNCAITFICVITTLLEYNYALSDSVIYTE